MAKEVAKFVSGGLQACFAAALAMCLFSCAPLTAQEKQGFDGYRVSPGDVLQVSVDQHPELSKRVMVRPDGNITLPSIKVVKVLGLSEPEIAALLHVKLESVAPKAHVTVNVIIHSAPPSLRRAPSPADPPPADRSRQG